MSETEPELVCLSSSGPTAGLISLRSVPATLGRDPPLSPGLNCDSQLPASPASTAELQRSRELDRRMVCPGSRDGGSRPTPHVGSRRARSLPCSLCSCCPF
ncbi:hypothetical protein SKAU_G00324090 [Synaphobranchus kaupii]|uniref:Uncharacterized protein n=1 Tax=Synaphobranchus kaupii TaxID=118154 RepID=A0A9Q1IK28_SYNKA|nr:hypothetical protein SKAU_G00324090 [Synaphobranchus kaupii]